jgi:hypothetical protein
MLCKIRDLLKYRLHTARRRCGRSEAIHPFVFRHIYRLAIIIILPVILTGYGCAPSVRYTREQPEEQSLKDYIISKRKPDDDRPQEPEEIRKPPPGHLQKAAASYIGIPYKYGGTTRAGLDCSGFVSLFYREVYNKSVPRTSAKMWKAGAQVSLKAARPGDLVFFRGGSFGAIDHVGIYLGHNKFIHASTSSGVIYSSLKESYHSRRFAGVRRLI